MKKLLGMIGALGFVATSATSAVSCGSEMFSPEIPDDDASNKKLVLVATKFNWNQDYKTGGILNIYMNHEPKALPNNKDCIAIIGEDNNPVEISFKDNDIYRSGKTIHVDFSADNWEKFKPGKKYKVSILNYEYENSKATGTTHNSITYGPIFKIPRYDNVPFD